MYYFHACMGVLFSPEILQAGAVKQLGYFWYIRLQHLKGNCSSLDFIAYTIQLAL